jgi:Protein of unknown function (DUF3300)
MNTTLKSKTLSRRKFVVLSPAVCSLTAALLGAGAVCFAQTPGAGFSPSVSPASSASPIASPDGQTQVNATATEFAEAGSSPKISADELESLVAPIALYPDPLLIQVLAASTYPLELVQLEQWMDKNKKLKGKALADAVTQQNWDPSVQGLSAFPAVVEKFANDIQWTTDLGNAFLAQESDLMDAVQRLRTKAQENGALKTNDKQTVATEETEDGSQPITIEPAQREVVYVPTYNTQVVYRDSSSSGYSGYSGYSGGSGYSGYSGSSGSSDDGYSYVGYAVGAAYGAAYGYYNWHDRYAEVNYNNYYNSRYNQNWNNKSNNWNNNVSNSNNNANSLSNKVNNLNGSGKFSQRPTEGTGRWQHDPSHRGNAPYANRDLANRLGQANNRLAGGASNRASQAPGANAANQLARGNRPSQLARANPGNQMARGNLSRPPGGSARPGTRPPNAAAPNRVGNQVPSNWPSTARGGGFGPPKGDFAHAVSARGAQSMGPPGGFRGGPAGAFGGGPPTGGFHGGPPMGGGLPMGGGPPIGGGLPMGGAPPPPPPPPPAP